LKYPNQYSISSKCPVPQFCDGRGLQQKSPGGVRASSQRMGRINDFFAAGK